MSFLNTKCRIQYQLVTMFVKIYRYIRKLNYFYDVYGLKLITYIFFIKLYLYFCPCNESMWLIKWPVLSV